MPTTNPTGGKGYRVAFERFVSDLEEITRNMSLVELESLMASNAWAQSVNDLADAMLEQLLEDMNESGQGAITGLHLPTNEEALARAFALDNPFATAAANAHAAELVTEVGATTMGGIRSVVAQSLASETALTPQQLARRIRGYTKRSGERIKGIVGNHSRDAAAADRYLQQLLDAGMDPDAAARKASKLSRRYLKRRGENIARTELTFAQEGGKQAAWQSAQSQGYVAPQAVRQWFTAWDERTCSICAPLHNTTAPLDGSFPNGSSGPPAHPSCRCSTSLTTIVPGSTRRLKTPPGDEAAKRQSARNRRHVAEQRAAFRRRFRNVPQEA